MLHDLIFQPLVQCQTCMVAKCHIYIPVHFFYKKKRKVDYLFTDQFKMTPPDVPGVWPKEQENTSIIADHFDVNAFSVRGSPKMSSSIHSTTDHPFVAFFRLYESRIRIRYCCPGHVSLCSQVRVQGHHKRTRARQDTVS